MATTRAEVSAFLIRAKTVAVNSFDLVWTEKNKKTMIKLGYLSKDEVRCHISALTVADYIDGPCADYDPVKAEDVWIFAPEIDGLVFYVKLKIIAGSQVKCLSFHGAEYPVKSYPHRT